MGHNTPTNVFAWTGEQIRELHKAIAITSFFTSHFPPSSASVKRGMASLVGSDCAGPLRRSVIAPTPVIPVNSR